MVSELYPAVLFRLGPLEVTTTVATTAAVSSAIVVLAWAAGRSLRTTPGRWQAALEAVVLLAHDTVQAIVPEPVRSDGEAGREVGPWDLVPLVGTLGIFIAVANVSDLLPGVAAPTGDLSTTAALAALVLLAGPFYGIRARGLRAYVRSYVRPTPLMLPFNLIGEVSRTIALAVRLFGNVMSLGLVVAVLLLVAGVLVPVPIMALGLLTGLIQAYIFAVLAAVYVGAAVRGSAPAPPEPEGGSEP